VPCAHNRHIGIRRVAIRRRVRAKNVEYAFALPRVSFGGKPGFECGLASPTLQLPKAALKRGG
jgi:hypothetical protein